MKKNNVAIITIFDIDNYGNRLQNYAVQEILKKRGLYPITIKSEYFKNNFKYILWPMYKFLQIKYDIFFKKNLRRKRFIKFNRENISCSRIYYNSKYCPKFNYDYYVCGSDQIWNPYMNKMKNLDLLSDYDKEKCIALSASFGVSELKDNEKNILKENIDKFKCVSVREKSGVEIIRGVSKKNVELLLDPTMILSVNEWKKLEKKFENLPDKYIATYFLSEPTKEIRKNIIELSEKYKCEIVNIMDKNDIFYTAGPSEFLYIIRNSKFVFTDSFHATTFSILCNIPFFVVHRDYAKINLNNRILTILEKFKLQERFIKNFDLNMCHCDFTNANNILEDERKKFNIFLDKCFEVNNEK